MRVPAVLVALVLGLMTLASCDGGSSGGGGSGTAASGTVSGTVAGTTVVAVNSLGQVVASDSSAGKAPNAQGQFPFTLTGIPVGQPVRLFLITGGGIFPMFFGNSNFFTLSAPLTIGLGFVGVAGGPNGPIATPQIPPTAHAGVTGSVSDPDGIPPGLITPETGGLTFSQLLANGLAAIDDGAFVRARTFFMAANARLREAPTTRDAQTAQFFSALTRIAAILADPFSDGNAGDLNRLGDLLDKFGCATSARRRASIEAFVHPTQQACPDPLTMAPNGDDFKTFSDAVLDRELMEALDTLSQLPPDIDLPIERLDTEIDYGDVLFLRGSVRAQLALDEFADAYHVGLNVTQALLPPHNALEAIFAENPALLTTLPGAAAKLAAARSLLLAGLTDLHAAIVAMQGETDPQENDFINLIGSSPAEIQKALAYLAAAQASLTNGQAQAFPDGAVVNLGPLFTGSGLNLRATLPPFQGNRPGHVPDQTLNGVVPDGLHLNENLDQDNQPLWWSEFWRGVRIFMDNLTGFGNRR